jgi:GNAT superfamily N-acetyltransferase
METKITKERIIDGTLFSSFEEFFDLVKLLVYDDFEKEIEPSLENLKMIMESQKDYYVLLTWENADLSKIAFSYDMTARYYEDRAESHPEYHEYAEMAKKQLGRTLFGLITDIFMDKESGYNCELLLVDGLRMAEYEFDYHKLSATYDVELISENNYEEVLQLYKDNMQYFDHLGIEPTIETVAQDAHRCPKDCDPSNKYFVVLRDPDVVGAARIYLHYPRQDAVWIDFIMISSEMQGLSFGSEILRDMLDVFADCGFMWAEAGYVKGNRQAEKFWHRNWFVDLLTETREDDGLVYHHMIRGLQ